MKVQNAKVEVRQLQLKFMLFKSYMFRRKYKNPL